MVEAQAKKDPALYNGLQFITTRLQCFRISPDTRKPRHLPDEGAILNDIVHCMPHGGLNVCEQHC